MKTHLSRRELLENCACGMGYVAFTSMFASLASTLEAAEKGPLALRHPHFSPKAKRIIFLFMHGGPSHVDTFDYKPLLSRDAGKPLPQSFRQGGFLDVNAKLMPSPFAFRKAGQSGLEISEVFPQIAQCADDLCLLRGMHTKGQDHTQAVLNLHTGSNSQVRPSMGSWILYGLGSENQNLPGFVTISPPIITGGPQNYGSSFLPAVYQGTPIGQQDTPLTQSQIAHIKNPELPLQLQRQQLDFVQELNREHLARSAADRHVEGVIQSYELAFRMQTEVPEVTSIASEPESILRLYGVDQTPTDNFARQCLLARRLAERGVRFIQISHNFRWDQHQNLKTDITRNAAEVDQPIAALLRDLKSRDMLKDTLVIWGGEFGRTPTAQGGMDGRDHNPHGFTLWMAGGGVKGGLSYGATDDYGYKAVDNTSDIHDLHATILHLLGLEHEKLTFRYAGRDFRLTDVHGQVMKAILA
jgi:Protein of unknown function (DUF1501)